MASSIDYNGKTALVTGAASGIGAAFCRQLASKGTRLILVDVNEESLETVYANLAGRDLAHVAHVADVGNEEQRLNLIDKLGEQKINVDILINNVGIGYWSDLVETDWIIINQVIDVNVKATTHFTYLFLPGMLERDEGLIVNVASTGAYCGACKAAVYTGTKAFVANFTEAVDMELHNTNVRTLTAFPGATDTGFWEAAGTINSDMYNPSAMMTSEETVLEFLKAYESGHSTIIAGWKNRVMVFLSKFIPREMLKSIALRKYR